MCKKTGSLYIRYISKVNVFCPTALDHSFDGNRPMLTARIYVSLDTTLQGITFEVSDRSRSLLLAQINNLGSDLSRASIAKIARYLQMFVLTNSFLSIRFTKKVYTL